MSEPNSVKQDLSYSAEVPSEGTASSKVKDADGSIEVQELVALKNIKAGQEITRNFFGYIPSCILMLNRERRLKLIEQIRHFYCFCDRCLVDDICLNDIDPTVNYEKLQELIFEEAEYEKDYLSIVNFYVNIHKRKWVNGNPESTEEFRTIQQKFPFEKCRRHVQVIRLLYNHGKEKRAKTLV